MKDSTHNACSEALFDSQRLLGGFVTETTLLLRLCRLTSHNACSEALLPRRQAESAGDGLTDSGKGI